MANLHRTIALPCAIMAVALLACSVDLGTWPQPINTPHAPTYTPHPTHAGTPPVAPPPTQTRFTTPTPIALSCEDCADEAWTTYSSSEYGFSISFPAYLEIVPGANTPTLYIGDQVHVWMSDTDPLQCRGDCLVVETTSPARVAGLDATRVAGYMGAIGGSIPQRYLRYILQHDDRYYVFTLFALGSHAMGSDDDTIWPLEEDDITLFEHVLETLKFTNQESPLDIRGGRMTR